MPTPNSVPELLDRVRRSGLLPAGRLEALLAELTAAGHFPEAPADLLDRLLDAGLVTRFHADKLAQGKYKGFQLGRYLILDLLGTGGMGQVYLAEHLDMRRLVALKVLSPQAFENDPVARERFFREARAAGTLDHPNIARVYDLCQDGKLLYLVMEYVDGVSLQALVARGGAAEVGAACRYAQQVALGLQHAHDLGFIHRDVKPANLLLDRTGAVKILDLGLVRSEADAEVGLTRQFGDRSILGTADYVAPEQAVDSSQVDHRADIYSLGATLYFLLAGRPLFPEGRTAQKLVWQQLKEPVPIDRVRPDLPEGLAEVVHQMLRKRPDERFQTAAEVFEALLPFAPEEVSAPAAELFPPVSARVALARSVGTPAPRGGGTAQAVALSTRRPGGGGSSGGSSMNHSVLGGASTAAVAKDHTHPGLKTREDPTESSPALPAPSGARRLVLALSASLVLALAGIAVLLLNR